MRIQYEDNRDDKHDGFYILRKIDLNNIPNEQQNYLRKIGAADIRTYGQNINEFKTWRDEYQSGDSTTTGATTAMEMADRKETHEPVEGEILEQALKMSKKR